MTQNNDYRKGFLPYALGAVLIGLVGGFSSVLGPAFVADLGLAYNNTTWTALAQAMSTAACAPILGKVGDLIGRRATLLLGIAVFTLGNVLSALAPSLWFMLIARFAVGVGTAAMAPVILSYIVTQFPPQHVARGFSIYMLLSSISVIFGPTLGALVVSSAGWRAMLWLCVGLCCLTFAACLATAKKAPGPSPSAVPFDSPGAVLVLVFFSLILCIPSFGQNFGWGSAAFFAVALGALFSLGGLIAVETRANHPILPGRFMKRPAFLLSVATLFLTQGLMQANMTNTMVFVSYTQPGNTLLSGYAISVMYLGMSLGAALLGPLADRYEPKRILLGALLLTGVGCGLPLLFSSATPPALLLSSLGILGLGLGGNGTILLKVALAGLPQEQAGQGTGTYGLFRDLSAPFGVAVFVPLFTNHISQEISLGTAPADAAVQAMELLALAQLGCVAAGMLAVSRFPRIHSKGA